MKTKFLLCLLLFALEGPAQVTLSGNSTTLVSSDNQSVRRAVVIGISDYQDEKIPDLKYAHKDAEAFAAWLQSEAGAGLSSDQIKLLTNEKAKGGNIVAELTWLTDESKKGDKAIIYFSGHGDVEKATKFQRGYLLPYDSPPTTYMAGAISVLGIQDYVATLSSSDVQVLMITDACRAGKLAGSEYGGAQATTAALKEQFAKEIKILSCQPDEFSIEGEEWGGGRGCFSYHLIDGLYGLADQNQDLSVNLMEIRNYLEEKVSLEAAPQSQVPFTVGNPKSKLSSVNEAWLAALKNKKADELAALGKIDSKGIEDLFLADMDTSIQELYKAFIAAIESNQLMEPDSVSADHYYRILIQEPETRPLHGYMKRNFAAALMNEAQEVTNKVLKTDPQVISDTWSRPFVFDHIPVYLERAAELLSEDHFIYNTLKAKQYYFEAKTYREENYPDLAPDSLGKLELIKLEKALTFDSSAAYIYVDLGVKYYWFFLNSEKALVCAQKALNISPNFVYAHYLAGRVYGAGYGDFSQGLYHYHRALDLDSTFLLTYQELSLIYGFDGLGSIKESAFYRDKYIQKVQALLEENPDEVPIYYRTLLGAELWRAGRLQEAEKVLLLSERLTNHQDAAVYQYLSVLYQDMERFDDAVEAIKKVNKLVPFNIYFHIFLGNLYEHNLNLPLKAEETYKAALALDSSFVATYIHLGELYQKEIARPKEAEKIFHKALEYLADNPHGPYIINNYGRAYLGLGRMEDMERIIKTSVEADPQNAMVYYQAACLYSLAKKEQQALEWLVKALERGFLDFKVIKWDYDLDNIRDSKGFRELMKKYFPEQFDK